MDIRDNDVIEGQKEGQVLMREHSSPEWEELKGQFIQSE